MLLTDDVLDRIVKLVINFKNFTECIVSFYKLSPVIVYFDKERKYYESVYIGLVLKLKNILVEIYQLIYLVGKIS